MTGAEKDELALAVARDVAVTACLIHRLAAVVALAETGRCQENYQTVTKVDSSVPVSAISRWSRL